MTWDVNGNKIINTVKSITYNHLNLPTNITVTGGKTIDFTYNATGNKLRKVVKTGATINLVQVTDPVSNEMSIGKYINACLSARQGIEYRGTAIPATSIESIYLEDPVSNEMGIGNAEGRLYYTGSVWQREFTIRDLPIAIGIGNTRITYADINGDGVVATQFYLFQP